MSFLIGMIMGISVGIGLIVAFAKYENIRSMHRSQLATTVAAFARMTVRDSRKFFLMSFTLLGLSFHRDRINLLNAHLDKIWPYVNEAASDLIRSNVEPILEQYTPAIFSSMKFSKLTLGTVAPQFTGVCIVEEESGDKVSPWNWRCSGMAIQILFLISIQELVKNIGFTGVFRLVFKPLAEEFPCFGAVSYSLREKKKLDFTLKVVGGEISAIPGLSDAIEETIRDAVEDSITWPVRKIVSILPGDYSDLELKPVGTLEVKLVQGKDLTNKDLVGKSDPYAVLFIRPLRSRMKTSKTINNQLNPIWNEHFEFVVEDASTQHLTVRVFDDEGVQAAELIVDVWLKLVKDLEIQRDNKYRGQVHLELLYCPYGTESNFKNPFNPDFQLTT
uniref:C2 domain-containing protein n=1 Tax=Salix viminalis TaxID=40686 RepID=A0A6N2K1H1_SALVM